MKKIFSLMVLSLFIGCTVSAQKLTFVADELPLTKKQMNVDERNPFSIQEKLFFSRFIVRTITDLSTGQAWSFLDIRLNRIYSLNMEEVYNLIDIYKYYIDTLCLTTPNNNLVVRYELTHGESGVLYLELNWIAPKWNCSFSGKDGGGNLPIGGRAAKDTWLWKLGTLKELMEQNTKGGKN